MIPFFDENQSISKKLTENDSQELFDMSIDDVKTFVYEVIDAIYETGMDTEAEVIYDKEGYWQDEGYQFDPYRNDLFILEYKGNIIRLTVSLDGEVEYDYIRESSPEVSGLTIHSKEEYETYVTKQDELKRQERIKRKEQDIASEKRLKEYEIERQQREVERQATIQTNIAKMSDRDNRFYTMIKQMTNKTQFENNFKDLQEAIQEVIPTFSHIAFDRDMMEHNYISFKVYIRVEGNKRNTGFECRYNTDKQKLQFEAYHRVEHMTGVVRSILAAIYFEDVELIRTRKQLVRIYELNRIITMNLVFSGIFNDVADAPKGYNTRKHLPYPMTKPIEHYANIDNVMQTSYRIEHKLYHMD